MTAVFTRPEASIAARSPAPPAPTITASYVWVVVTVDGHFAGSKVTTMIVPSTISAAPRIVKNELIASRTRPGLT